MKKKEKIVIGVLIAITIIAIIALIIMNSKGGKSASKENKTKSDMSYELEDGTQLNTSSKLNEIKKFDGMEISNIQITQKNNVSLLLAKIVNTSNTKQGGYVIDIKIIDKQGNEIKTVPFLVKELEPGETTQLNASATFDFVDAYDFVISKKEW